MMNFQRGNAFVYILIAVALFGGLMFTLSRSAENDAPQTQMDESKAKLAANEILSYAAVASNAVTQMDQSGVQSSQIDFMYPDDTNFNTAPTIYKLFHPDGGGLNYKTLPVGGSAGITATPKSGYYIGRFNNIVWTPTTARDVIFTAYGITQPVCAALNVKINGSATIPTTTGADPKTYLIDKTIYSGSNVDLDKTLCAACEDVASLCISSTASGSTVYTYYNILGAE